MAERIAVMLLDTCSLLWLADNPAQLSEKAQAELRKPDAPAYVSAISAFELGVKVAKRKLGLQQPISGWFPEVCARFGLVELPVTGAIAAAASELPPLHGDPADRILIATAHGHHLVILTPDPLIAKYPNVQVIW